ncbi:hypothetical protein N7520_006630 [Penicillium odoratum]|uniref:uncharacterized protein n=1 Tax=Penicillium odoratum TaxID=1167516 RepID=UPI0025489B98|nr:uncharacterized protein N7520_006630 [Penicillium odoratum]KAJ5759474.1 hypothetical protein N7520_006630 [Penicillium odoratum]
MAAVFVPPSPKTSMNMSTRRPLANVPNATNSPHRTGLVPAKRVRSNQLEISYGQPPPKKQVMEAAEQNRSSVVQGADSKLFARRPNNANPSAFEKKLVAARDKERQPQVKAVKGEKPSADTLDTIRQWQRHYRKAFPQFVFYFDSVPEDARRKFSRQVAALGAREEKFFSRLVTHVVTSRPIPAGVSVTSPTEVDAVDGNGDGNVQTVNPSLLDKSADWLKHEIRRDQASNDVLQRARQMGMKIWALEKLQRMITTINDNDLGGQNDPAVRSRNAGASTANGRGENDLSRVLRQELMNGPSDRDPLSSMEMIVFKGPFIYIHDMNEKTKPVMVREYSRVAKRQDGAWPQFRSAPLGKCPFVDEPPSRKEYDRHRIRQSQKEKKAAAVAETRQNVPKTIEQEQKTVAKIDPDQANVVCERDEEFDSKPRADETHERKSSESFIPPHFPRSGPFYTGREPAASGVQPSNVTSAIRSQMISSTAAAPGARAGLSKEVHGLKRKVLERGTGNIAHGSMAAPERPNGLAMHLKTQHSHATNPAAGARHNPEDHNQEGAGIKRRRDDSHESEQKKPERRRDPKPGYCENCRDKFDDFEEHTLTRKHRRFAQNASNWVELDALLAEIQRPLKNDLDRIS